MRRRRHQPSLIVASLVAALILTIIPIPAASQWFRPYWVAMALIFWCVEAPEQVGLGGSFFTGLALDLLTGSLFGQHALSLVIIAYIVGRMRLRMRFFPLWQQAIMVFALLLNDRIIYAWVHAMSGRGWPDWQLAWAPLIAMLIWPWLFLLLDYLRQRSKIR